MHLKGNIVDKEINENVWTYEISKMRLKKVNAEFSDGKYLFKIYEMRLPIQFINSRNPESNKHAEPLWAKTVKICDYQNSPKEVPPVA